MDHWARRYPTSVDDVAAVLAQLTTRAPRPAGILHFSGNEVMTKWELVQLIAELAGGRSIAHITPDATPPAAGTPRPFDAALESSAIYNLLNFTPTPVRHALRATIESHPRREDSPQ